MNKYFKHKVVGDELCIKILIPKGYSVAMDWDDTIVDSRDQFLNAISQSYIKYGTCEKYSEFEYDIPSTLPESSKAILNELRRAGVDVHLVSNKTTVNLMKSINDLKLFDYFKSIQGSCDKPNDKFVLTRINDKGIMFGDNARNDGMVALKAGWEFVRMDEYFFPFSKVKVSVCTALTNDEINRFQNIFGD